MFCAAKMNLFLVRNNEGFTQYIQVSQTVQNPDTLAKELAPLNSISDHHEKLLITMDFDTGTYNGIKKINIIDWLMAINWKWSSFAVIDVSYMKE